jgi:thiol-disulfide isomerase/thioredoxin
MKKIILYFFIALVQFTYGQTEQVTDTLDVDASYAGDSQKDDIAEENSHIFSFSIHKNINKFISSSNAAYKSKNMDEAKSLFDTLVANHLKGKQFDNFTFKKFGSKKPVVLKDVKKPIFLVTYASWCILSLGEISALNDMASKYKDRVKVVVLYWDRRENLVKIEKDFSDNIEFCYAHDTYNDDNYLISTLKHTLGFPTTYLLDENLKVVNIIKGSIVTPFVDPKDPKFEQKYIETKQLNVDRFQSFMDQLIPNTEPKTPEKVGTTN